LTPEPGRNGGHLEIVSVFRKRRPDNGAPRSRSKSVLHLRRRWHALSSMHQAARRRAAALPKGFNPADKVSKKKARPAGPGGCCGPGYCRGSITITDAATHCLQSGFFLPACAIFRTVPHIFRTSPMRPPPYFYGGCGCLPSLVMKQDWLGAGRWQVKVGRSALTSRSCWTTARN
jgi:hypothetical protein